MQREKHITLQFVLLSAAASAVLGDELFGMRLTTETLKTKENTHYRFHYFVKDEATGDYKSQEETKEGDSVRGSYTLAEPNGDLRTVTYRAGPGTGFEAKVDVQPSASPMRRNTEQTSSTSGVSSDVKTEATTLKSNVKRFPGGFIMDILKKPQTDLRTEMGMKFSLNANLVTEPVTNAVTPLVSKTTAKLETTTELASMMPSENLERTKSEAPTETTEVTEDPIEKEIDEVENLMPKLPEVILSDNKTHFKFYKDPEEAMLDERITQIAKQLAETSLRREYEEHKLGHLIPISVTSVEPVTTTHSSKSIKFPRADAPKFRPSQQSPLQVLAELKFIPHYIYKETILPKFLPAQERLPVHQTSHPPKSNKQWDEQTYETITDFPELLKLNKTDTRINEINKITNAKDEKLGKNYETTERKTVSVLPIQIPTLLHFFSPYPVSTQGSYFTQTKANEPLQATTVKENLATTQIALKSDTKADFTTIAHKYNFTKS